MCRFKTASISLEKNKNLFRQNTKRILLRSLFKKRISFVTKYDIDKNKEIIIYFYNGIRYLSYSG